jgi:hypothetical protein
MFGVLMTMFFAYVMGRWPNTHYYTAYIIVVPSVILIRFINYRPKGWHYFLFDFCYYGSATVLLFIAYFPKNMVMYRCAFMFANGALAASTAAFNNSLIFHKFDHLINIVTHAIPLICIWNVR